jgi:hypothetical protein
MKITATFSSLLIASAVVIAGCSAPPAADVNDTKPAVDEAGSSPASRHTADQDQEARAIAGIQAARCHRGS